MGGNSGGSFSEASFAELEQRILDRLRGLAKSANRILFAAEAADSKALSSHMVRDGFGIGEKVSVAIGPDAATFVADMPSIQLLVTFSDTATETHFLSTLVESAFAAGKQGIHVKARPDAAIPSKVLAYRWRVMTWAELVALLT